MIPVYIYIYIFISYSKYNKHTKKVTKKVISQQNIKPPHHANGGIINGYTDIASNSIYIIYLSAQGEHVNALSILTIYNLR